MFLAEFVEVAVDLVEQVRKADGVLLVFHVEQGNGNKRAEARQNIGPALP